jgi:hypothetical protein
MEKVDLQAAVINENGRDLNIFQIINPVIDTTNKGKLLAKESSEQPRLHGGDRSLKALAAPTTSKAGPLIEKRVPRNRPFNQQRQQGRLQLNDADDELNQDGHWPDEGDAATVGDDQHSSVQDQSRSRGLELIVSERTHSSASGESASASGMGSASASRSPSGPGGSTGSRRWLQEASGSGSGRSRDRFKDSGVSAESQMMVSAAATSTPSTALARHANAVIHTIGSDTTNQALSEKQAITESLRRINLRNVCLCDDGAWTFALYMQANSVVEEVDLSYNGISDDGNSI